MNVTIWKGSRRRFIDALWLEILSLLFCYKKHSYICLVLLENYRLIVEGWFARPSDPESYAGGSLSSWLSHPCQTGQNVRVRLNVVPGPPGWWLGMELTTPPQKIYCYETSRAYRGEWRRKIYLLGTSIHYPIKSVPCSTVHSSVLGSYSPHQETIRLSETHKWSLGSHKSATVPYREPIHFSLKLYTWFLLCPF
jgi:hypothetical protein